MYVVIVAFVIQACLPKRIYVCHGHLSSNSFSFNLFFNDYFSPFVTRKHWCLGMGMCDAHKQNTYKLVKRFFTLN